MKISLIKPSKWIIDMQTLSVNTWTSSVFNCMQMFHVINTQKNIKQAIDVPHRTHWTLSSENPNRLIHFLCILKKSVELSKDGLKNFNAFLIFVNMFET